MTPDQTAALIRLSHEAGHLKQTPRTGWLRAGVRMPESVAEHSWRVSVLACQPRRGTLQAARRARSLAACQRVPAALPGQ